MKTTKPLMIATALLFAGTISVSAQNSELDQLKETMKAMEQTIQQMKKKIAELEQKAQATPPAPPRTLMESNSPSIQTLEKVAAG